MKTIRLQDLQLALKKNVIENGGAQVQPDQLSAFISKAEEKAKEVKESKKSDRLGRLYS